MGPYSRWRERRIAELESESAVVETARGPIEVARTGEGPPVLLAHGAPGGCDQIFYAKPLAAAGFSLICPSRPGYLRTPPGVGRSHAEQADALAALLDALDVAHVGMLGASAGGPIAIEFAARHPERTRALVLECAVTQRYDPEVPAWARALFLSAWGTWAQVWLFERFPRFAVQQLVAQESTYTAAERRRVAAKIAADPEALAFAGQLVGTLTPYDRRRDGLENDLVQLAAIGALPLDQIRCPTLIAHGTADADVPHADAEHAAERIPNAELLSVDGGWHVLPLSPGAERVLDRQREFLAKHLT